MKKNDVSFLGENITVEQLITEKERILKTFPEATNFKIESRFEDYYGSQHSYLVFTFDREETEREKEQRLNLESRENKIRVMNFKREQEALKKLDLI